MPILNFPESLIEKQDSSKYSVASKSNSIKADLDGGYVHARPRTTRRPRREFTSGFTEISGEDFQALMSFYGEVGEHSRFYWRVKIMPQPILVRFEGVIKGSYAGIGNVELYNVGEIKLVEV